MFRRKANLGVTYERFLEAKPQAVLVAACDECRTRRGTDRRVRICLQKTQALRGQMIDVGCLKIGAAVTCYVGITEIISENEDNVRRFGRWRRTPDFESGSQGKYACSSTAQQVAPRHCGLIWKRHWVSSVLNPWRC